MLDLLFGAAAEAVAIVSSLHTAATFTSAAVDGVDEIVIRQQPEPLQDLIREKSDPVERVLAIPEQLAKAYGIANLKEDVSENDFGDVFFHYFLVFTEREDGRVLLLVDRAKAGHQTDAERKELRKLFKKGQKRYQAFDDLRDQAGFGDFELTPRK